MNVRKKNYFRIFASNCLVVSLALLATACFFSTKAIYFEKEISVAEGASAQLHEWHNQQNFNAILDILDPQPTDREEALRQIKAAYDKVGRSLETRLVEKKVVAGPGPGYTSQVRLAYETKFEKGSWTELLAWNIKNSSSAVLANYLIEPTAAPSPASR